MQYWAVHEPCSNLANFLDPNELPCEMSIYRLEQLDHMCHPRIYLEYCTIMYCIVNLWIKPSVHMELWRRKWDNNTLITIESLRQVGNRLYLVCLLYYALYYITSIILFYCICVFIFMFWYVNRDIYKFGLRSWRGFPGANSACDPLWASLVRNIILKCNKMKERFDFECATAI